VQYDWFIDTVPEVIERVEQAEKRGEAKGEEKGIEKGELQALRRSVMNVVQMRFPALLTFCQVHIEKITQLAQLDKLLVDLMQAPDEVAVIRLLSVNGQTS